MRPSAHLPKPRDDEATGVPANLRDRRIEVSVITRVRSADGERAVRIVGLSARSALLFAPEQVGWVGRCVDIDIPIVGGRDLAVMAGVVRSERCREGYAVTLEFVIIEAEVRRQLNELLALLLAGEPESDARRPRLIYDVPVAYGPMATQRAYLHEISLSGLSMRVAERIPFESIVDVMVPTVRGGAPIAVSGRIAGQQLSPEGGYITAVSFEPLDPARRLSLGALVADLMCR